MSVSPVTETDWNVEKVKSLQLHPDLRNYRPDSWTCARCGFVTELVTAAFVHAWVQHQDKTSA